MAAQSGTCKPTDDKVEQQLVVEKLAPTGKFADADFRLTWKASTRVHQPG